jgi:heme-degrading monooxygenase HmoA
MFTRIVHLTLKTNAAPEFAKLLEQKIVPALRGEPGFLDELLFMAPGGPEVLAASIWDTREDAENYERSAFPQVLRTIEHLIEGAPRIELYQLAYSTLHRSGLSEFPHESPITTPTPGVGGG